MIQGQGQRGRRAIRSGRRVVAVKLPMSYRSTRRSSRYSHDDGHDDGNDDHRQENEEEEDQGCHT